MKEEEKRKSIPEEYQPLSMWTYFGYEIVFSLPIIGFIMLLIISLGKTKNKNLKNFARSYFCFQILSISLITILLILFISIYAVRKAERLIEKGLVTVNGQKAKLGQKASYTDNIIVENKLLNKKEEKVYFLLNKPRGVVSTVTDDKERKTITSLINTDKRIYPIGRLDYDTTGAIILTNDGELANILMHPKNRIERSYYVKVEGFITKEELNRFKHPILVENKTCNIEYCKIKKYDKKTNTSYVLMILKEGHNHEVKNIFKAINHPVIKLKRESFAELRVDNLKSGEYRKLLPKEIKKLYSYKKEERK